MTASVAAAGDLALTIVLAQPPSLGLQGTLLAAKTQLLQQRSFASMLPPHSQLSSALGCGAGGALPRKRRGLRPPYVPHRHVLSYDVNRNFFAGVQISIPMQVVELPGHCYACGATCDTRMFHTSIPHFKDVIIMSNSCDSCGYRDSEVKPGGGFSDAGRSITLQVAFVSCDPFSRF